MSEGSIIVMQNLQHVFYCELIICQNIRSERTELTCRIHCLVDILLGKRLLQNLSNDLCHSVGTNRQWNLVLVSRCRNLTQVILVQGLRLARNEQMLNAPPPQTLQIIQRQRLLSTSVEVRNPRSPPRLDTSRGRDENWAST